MSKKEPNRSITQYQKAEYTGPLPLPEHFRQYDEILPGAAERILRLAEEQSAHRQYLEKHVTKGDGRHAWAGLLVGGLVAGRCIGGGDMARCHWPSGRGHDNRDDECSDNRRCLRLRDQESPRGTKSAAWEPACEASLDA